MRSSYFLLLLILSLAGKSVVNVDDEICSRVTGILKKGLPDIDPSRLKKRDGSKKDLVIVMGPSQVGKSAMINTFLGARYEFKGGTLNLVEGEEQAKVGKKGVSETSLPKLYTDDQSGLAFLDTRGFFDTRGNAAEELAATILTEIVIRNAGSLKLIFLSSYNSVKEGIKGFGNYGEVISKLIKGGSSVEKVPFLFVVNKYQISLEEIKEYGGVPNYDQINKNILPGVIDELRDSTSINQAIHFKKKIMENEDVLKGLGIKVDQLIDSFQQRSDISLEDRVQSLGLTEKEQQEAVKQIFDNDDTHEIELGQAYIPYLSYNKSKKNIRYFDPSDGRVITSLLKQVRSLPTLDSSCLALDSNYHSKYRGDFNEFLYNNIKNFSILLETRLRLSRFFYSGGDGGASSYNAQFVENLIEGLNESRDFHESILQEMESYNIDTLKEAYNIDTDQNKKRISEIENQIAKNSDKIEIKQSLLDYIKSGEPILYREESWCKETYKWIFLWWRSHTFKYDGPKDFVDWKFTSTNGSFCKEVIKRESPHLHLYFESEWWKSCTGTVRVFIKPEDDPETLSKIKSLEREIVGLRNSSSAKEREITQINAELNDNLKRRIESFKDRFRRTSGILEEINNKSRAFNDFYLRCMPRVEIIRDLINLMGIGNQGNSDSQANIFVRTFEKIEEEACHVELLDTQIDPIFMTPLVDPVQFRCSDRCVNIHDRSKIWTYLKGNSKCPHCRSEEKDLFGDTLVKLTPISDNAIGIRDLINEIEPMKGLLENFNKEKEKIISIL